MSAMTPELALVGYLPRDLLLNPAFVNRSWQHLEALASELAGEPPVLVGLPEPNRADEGRPLFNAAVLLRHGRIDQRFRKALLPTYDVFDESRYFEPCRSPEANLVTIHGYRIGLVVCEDGWNDEQFFAREMERRPRTETA